MAKKATKKKPATKAVGRPASAFIGSIPTDPSHLVAWRASCAACDWTQTRAERKDAEIALVLHGTAKHDDNSMNGTVGLVTL